MRKITGDELHTILLDIGKEFAYICRKHNIPYYMLGGTMLGAVRHKGFIPWDDDMDFGVPRSYFERFKVVLSKELPEQYRLLTIDNCDGILSEIVKITDSRTLIREAYKEELKDEMGINIDIFPLDHTDANFGILSANRKIDILNKIQGYRFLSTQQRPLPKKLAAFAVKAILFALKRQSIPRYVREKLIKREGPLTANHYGAWGIRETVPNVVMGTPIPYTFEDTTFLGVADSHSYLTNLYGDYMQLPPENKRHLHIENMWYK